MDSNHVHSQCVRN